MLEYSYLRDDTPLVAALPGVQPAVVEGFGGQVKKSVSPVVLYLGGESLSINGIVLDAEGEPAVGWRVSLYDPTTVSLGTVPPVSAEQLTSASGRSSVSTDGEGRFRIEGLRDRSYRIQAYHQKSLAMIRSESVPAGTTDLVLRLGRDALSGKVRGQVVSRRGVPLAGVQVTPVLITTRIQNGKSWQSGETTTTDERGNFELDGVPLLEGELSVSGSAVIPQGIEVSPDQNLLTLTLEVAARCHLRIVVSGPLAEAKRFRILDATDQPLSIYTFDSSGWSSSTTQTLIDGRSPTVAVSEDARTLVFQKDDQKEIGRIGLRLTPSEVTVITP